MGYSGPDFGVEFLETTIPAEGINLASNMCFQNVCGCTSVFPRDDIRVNDWGNTGRLNSISRCSGLAEKPRFKCMIET